jgi:hypothetical protein
MRDPATGDDCRSPVYQERALRAAAVGLGVSTREARNPVRICWVMFARSAEPAGRAL